MPIEPTPAQPAQPQAPTTTPPPPAAVVPPPARPAAPAEDPRFAALAAKESAIVKAQREIAAQRDSFAKERQEYEAWKQQRTQATRNPEVLAKEVWGDNWYDKLTEFRLNGQQVTPDIIAQTVSEQLSAFEKRQADARAAQEATQREQAQAQAQQAYDNFKQETHAFVAGRGEEYELINLHGAHNLVTRAIEQHFEATQKIMTAKEAADLVEAHLAEQVQKSLATKRFTAKAQPQPNGESQREGSAQPRTLTNALTGSTPAPNEGVSMYSDAERIRRAIAAGEAARRK